MSDNPEKAPPPSAETLKQSLRHNVEQLGVPELTALIEFAQQTRQQKQVAARDALLAEFTERASALGFSLQSLVAQPTSPARPTKAKTGTDKLPAKYRGPSGEEWSGRGRTPTWLTVLESQGKKREEFAA